MNNKKIAIIGAGVSGMSIAQLLKDENEVVVFESDSRPGGLIKCDHVNGHLFHRTGGHVFNTKRKDVFDWYWQKFNREKEFTKADRNSVVSMEDGRIVSYPIENHAYQFSDSMMRRFINDIIEMSRKNHSEPKNFAEFLKDRFGNTLYEEYFKPYNEKIWRRPLSNVPLSWLEGKLPMPSLEDIIYNNFNHVEEKQFVHSTFYYPNSGGSQFIANRLSDGINIRYNTNVTCISKERSHWNVCGDEFDIVVFCGNLKEFPSILSGIDLKGFVNEIDSLESHGTTTVLCEIDDNPYSWVYLPSRKHQAHRIICTGNFAISNNAVGKKSATIEFTDEISKDEILENLKFIPFKPKYITHNFAPYTYPIQAKATREVINKLKEYIEPMGMYMLGRFAEWEYYNTDVAMGAAMDLVKRIR